MGIFSGGSFPTSGGTVIITQDGYQTLNLTGNILTISGSNSSVDLSSYLDDTNTTNTSLTLNASNVLTLTDSDSGTVTVDLTSLVTAAGGTAESTHIPVKNTSGATITKGTPVYITGNVGSSNRLQIAPADASDPAKMPAIGLLETDLINNAEGYVVQGGYLTNITTDIIDGTSTSSNDTVYVKVGGGITMTKPTGSTNYIQNIAKIARVGSGSSGSLIVSSILRTNDIPNLADGQVWVGSTTYPVSTDFNLQEVTDGGNTTTNKITINRSTTDHIELYNTNYSSGVSISASAGYLNVKPDSASYGMIFRNSADNTKYLVFNTNASDYGEIRYKETSSKIIIHNNGNIGINESSPDAKLHIVGADGDGLILEGEGVGAGSSTSIVMNPVFDVYSRIVSSREGSNLFSYLAFETGIDNSKATHERMRITSTGAVGIGTSTPIAKLEVSGDFATGRSVIIEATNATKSNGAYTLEVDSSAHTSNMTNAGALKVDVYNGTALLVNGHGDIGIGTSSPSSKLHIFGSFNEQFFTQQSGTTNKFGISSGTAYTGFSVGSSTTQAARFYHDNSYITFAENGANVGINKTSPSAKLHIEGSGNTSGTTSLLVENSDGTDLLQITDGGNAIMNVNYLQLDEFVGGRYLKIAPAISGDTHKIESNSGSDIVVSSSNGNTLIIGGDGQHTFPQYTSTNFDGTPTSFLGVDASGNVVKTTSAGVLTPTLQEVTDAGNITTNPITVNQLNISDNYPILVFDDTDATVNFQLWAGNNAFQIRDNTTNGQRLNIDSIGNISLNAASGTSALLVKGSDGNVGIGTTSPSKKLHIIDDSGTYETAVFETSAGGSLIRNIDSTATVETGVQGGKWTARTGGLQRLTIDSNGNVGIGTSTPSAKLHIFDSGTSYTNLTEGITLSNNAGSTNDRLPSITWDYGTAGTPTFAAIETTRASSIGGNLVFHTAQTNGTLTERMRITSTGAVGIGTTSPSRPLSVQGVIGVNKTDGVEMLTLTPTATGGVLTLRDSSENPDIVLDARPNNNSYINNGGSFGIGTSSPSAKLEVVDDGDCHVYFAAGSNASDDVIFRFMRGGNSKWGFLTHADSGLRLYDYVGGGDHTYFAAGGNVGIGTISTSAKLHIVGTTTTSATDSLLIEKSDGTDMIRVNDVGVTYFDTVNYFNSSNYQRDGGQFRFYNSDNSNYLRMFHGGAGGLYISSADNGHQIMNLGNEGVGINTTSLDTVSLRVGNHTSSMIPLLVEASDASDLLQVEESGAVKFAKYGAGNNTGSFIKNLGVDSSGNIIERDRGWWSGVSTLTTDANGEFTLLIASGASGVTCTQYDPTGTAAVYIFVFKGISGGTATFKVYDLTGAAVTSTSVGFSYSYATAG
jgi:hypothetical protein